MVLMANVMAVLPDAKGPPSCQAQLLLYYCCSSGTSSVAVTKKGGPSSDTKYHWLFFSMIDECQYFSVSLDGRLTVARPGCNYLQEIPDPDKITELCALQSHVTHTAACKSPD